ncbi:hypothetical protein GA0074692_6708 [Micromonospora pallida]|uniref:Uncharacterized protein n=1 Tax=Micromonospora pallida TaxID=145854 RepID=A0A1C6TKW7_9ACTN|nr:hypothetical protein GA0074692_6708 [Micromonospora pallida]
MSAARRHHQPVPATSCAKNSGCPGRSGPRAGAEQAMAVLLAPSILDRQQPGHDLLEAACAYRRPSGSGWTWSRRPGRSPCTPDGMADMSVARSVNSLIASRLVDAVLALGAGFHQQRERLRPVEAEVRKNWPYSSQPRGSPPEAAGTFPLATVIRSSAWVALSASPDPISVDTTAWPRPRRCPRGGVRLHLDREVLDRLRIALGYELRGRHACTACIASAPTRRSLAVDVAGDLAELLGRPGHRPARPASPWPCPVPGPGGAGTDAGGEAAPMSGPCWRIDSPACWSFCLADLMPRSRACRQRAGTRPAHQLERHEITSTVGSRTVRAVTGGTVRGCPPVTGA